MSNDSSPTEAIAYPGPESVRPSGRAIEPWFTILLSALIPLIGALFAPAEWKTALHVTGGALCAWGLVLLVRHELEIRRDGVVTEQ
jgi:hypothetical protein